MVEITEDERKVIDSMKNQGATSKEKLKDADQIAKPILGMPKGKVANILMSLIGKRIVKRVAREKAAGYYLLETNV